MHPAISFSSALRQTLIGISLLMGLSACSPSLNWREVRPADADGLVALFPCKPDTAQRELAVPGLAGGPATVHLLRCDAHGATWALSYLHAGTPERLRQALPALDQALWDNVSAGDSAHAGRQALGPSKITGAASHPGALTWRLQGTRPISTDQAETVHVTAWSFAHGLTAFQASVWQGATPGSLQVDDPAVEAFVEGFNFPR
ncbi:MAG TPA: hypothetical protein H9903_13495 [Candidatus Aquabacterium excrementipullorum]|nr:hypothetical protein [Candidatus Aquabacterium excrementipullorum]